jgi:hypothetical protein
MSIQQFAITLGTCCSYWLDYAFVDVPGSTGWRSAYIQKKKKDLFNFGNTIFFSTIQLNIDWHLAFK